MIYFMFKEYKVRLCQYALRFRFDRCDTVDLIFSRVRFLRKFKLWFINLILFKIYDLIFEYILNRFTLLFYFELYFWIVFWIEKSFYIRINNRVFESETWKVFIGLKPYNLLGFAVKLDGKFSEMKKFVLIILKLNTTVFKYNQEFCFN